MSRADLLRAPEPSSMDIDRHWGPHDRFLDWKRLRGILEAYWRLGPGGMGPGRSKMGSAEPRESAQERPSPKKHLSSAGGVDVNGIIRIIRGSHKPGGRVNLESSLPCRNNFRQNAQLGQRCSRPSAGDLGRRCGGNGADGRQRGAAAPAGRDFGPRGAGSPWRSR